VIGADVLLGSRICEIVTAQVLEAAMSQIGSLNEEDRKKVTREIEQLQTRVIQTLVPTILAFG
jgi:hypothetical protein